MAKNGREFFVILHNIRSAHNVGSIFRSADAFGVSKLFLGGYTPTPLMHAAVAKTALGAENSVLWEKYWHTHKLIEALKNQGVQIVALEQTKNSVLLDKFKPAFPMALILGSEVNGLSEKILKYVDQVVEIPMYGMKESLNVSVAFGIAGYSLSQKRRKQ